MISLMITGSRKIVVVVVVVVGLSIDVDDDGHCLERPVEFDPTSMARCWFHCILVFDQDSDEPLLW